MYMFQIISDTYYFIDKNLISDETILNILKKTKELGYNNVYIYDHGTGKHIKYKSLNEFSII